ncbi:MAG: Polymerase/histidinol phosphatase-like protein [Linnemannia gamsii]|nr:MAG: Polymerase/histidinol phosphatase-like protein [Linnemannia gamsii]
MTSTSRNGLSHQGDNILLLPSSQATTPSATTASSFQEETSPSSSLPFNPGDTQQQQQSQLTPHINNSTSSSSIDPSLQQQQQQHQRPIGPFTPLRSTSSVTSRSSTASSLRAERQGGPFSSTAADTLVTQPTTAANSSVYAATAHAGEASSNSGPAKDSRAHPTANHRGEHGSKSAQFLHNYILTPLQSFQLYLSTTPRDRKTSASSFHPLLSKLPPWLLPHYRGRKTVLRSTLLRPLCRLLLLAVIVGILIVSTIFYSRRGDQPEMTDYDGLTEFPWTPINPRSYLSPMNASFGNNYDVLLNGHSHSIYSDGRMSPETLLKWHIANGFNAVVVSDHNTINGGLAAQEVAESDEYAGKITVIPAMELTNCRVHMNLVGINETIDYAIKKWPTDDDIRKTIARTHELGGIAIINHISWSNTTEYGYELPRLQNHPSREQLVEMGIDGIEIANGVTLDTISLKFVQDHNLIVITGADVHYPDSNAFSWTILNTNGNRTADNILAQLKARRSSFLFDPTGTQPLAYPPENPLYFRTAPPTLMGQYFQMFWIDKSGMYSFIPGEGTCHAEEFIIRWSLIGYFILWVFIGFLIFEAARLVIVGCCWGPFQRRKRYLRKRSMLEEEERGLVGGGGNGDRRSRSSVGDARHELEDQRDIAHRA